MVRQPPKQILLRPDQVEGMYSLIRGLSAANMVKGALAVRSIDQEEKPLPCRLGWVVFQRFGMEGILKPKVIPVSGSTYRPPGFVHREIGKTRMPLTHQMCIDYLQSCVSFFEASVDEKFLNSLAGLEVLEGPPEQEEELLAKAVTSLEARGYSVAGRKKITRPVGWVVYADKQRTGWMLTSPLSSVLKATKGEASLDMEKRLGFLVDPKAFVLVLLMKEE